MWWHLTLFCRKKKRHASKMGSFLMTRSVRSVLWHLFSNFLFFDTFFASFFVFCTVPPHLKDMTRSTFRLQWILRSSVIRIDQFVKYRRPIWWSLYISKHRVSVQSSSWGSILRDIFQNDYTYAIARAGTWSFFRRRNLMFAASSWWLCNTDRLNGC